MGIFHNQDSSSATSSSPTSTSTSSSSTCPPLPYSDPPQAIAGGLTLQHIFLICAGACTLCTFIISRFLVFKHLHRYTYPDEQRQIVRVVVTPIWFSVVSLWSIAFYEAADYLTPIANIYESFALTALFLLFVNYVAPDPVTRDAFFNNLPMKDRKGNETGLGSLGWFRKSWAIVFAYPLIFFFLSIVEWITLGIGKYCANSNKPKFAHIWITLFTNIATTIAVLRVIGFYNRLKQPMASHKPLLKLLSFKLIVGLNFLQSIIFSFVSGDHDVIDKLGAKFTFNDLRVGLPNLILCFEAVLLALMMHFTYRSREYHTNNGRTRMSTFRAFLDSFNFMDILRGIVLIPVYLSGGGSNQRTKTFEGYERYEGSTDTAPMRPYGTPPASHAYQ
ncbi:MAG: hypothetical protein M1820_000909 [Bogoriella megaspora]|nr:MAG: hypothetical protein M1820_000909 [Bogoriella megaspora]